MTSIDDARRGPTRESGKRLYVSPTDYQAQMRRGTIKGYDAGAAPWSEFEKPYWEDSYEEMEYFMWNWPGFAPWRWEFSLDNPSLPTTQESGLGGEFLVFECQVYGGFCPGDTRCVGVDCSHPITGVELSNSWAEREFTLSLASPTSLCITAVEDSALGVEVDFHMRSASGVVGGHEDILIGTAQDCEDCDTADPLTFDDDNNPTTVNNSTNYEITVLDGVGPFSWSVSGQDVSMQRAVTSNRFNYLQVGTSCGMIEITVIDSCGTNISTQVRSTNGSWYSCDGLSRGGTACECQAWWNLGGEITLFSGGNPWYIEGGTRFYEGKTITSGCETAYPDEIVACCVTYGPGVSGTLDCFPEYNLPKTCADPDSTPVPVCVNPCGSPYQITIRSQSDMTLEIWRCT